MIHRVEYSKISRLGQDGVTIIFTYENEMKDAYEVFGEDAETALLWLAARPNPEGLLIELRGLMRITVH